MPRKSLQLDLTPRPHYLASQLLEDKAPVLRDTFERLLPELRIRAFTISGVRSLDLIRRVRDRIASIPREHASWEDARADIARWLADWMDPAAARRRAELLLRTHAFQAYQAATWRAISEDPGTQYLQYLATEDDRVRDTHRALNGLILPKTDPFWRDHYPPWEWGCRCRARPVTDTEAEAIRVREANLPPEEQSIVEGPRLQRLRTGHLERHGRTFVVAKPPGRPIDDFSWSPEDLRITNADIEARIPPEDLPAWRTFTRSIQIGNHTLEQWLQMPALPWHTRRAGAAIDRVAATMRKLGFHEDRISNYTETAATLGIAPRVQTARNEALYRPTTKTVHIATHPNDWYGSRQTIAHELGHAWLDQYAEQHPNTWREIRQAMNQDWARWQQWLDRQIPGWRNIGPPNLHEAFAQHLYQSTFDALPMPARKRIGRTLDYIAAITHGRYGTGHARSYWANPTYPEHEAIAHTTEAYMSGDTWWLQISSAVAEWFYQRTGLTP